jgi:ribosomal protein S18 acetylase RimI-like enzyme
LLQHAISRSAHAMTTEVLVGNDAALAFYLAAGFTIVKKVDGKLAGNEKFLASGYVLRYALNTAEGAQRDHSQS